jgi:hypothetical protein
MLQSLSFCTNSIAVESSYNKTLSNWGAREKDSPLRQGGPSHPLADGIHIPYDLRCCQ